VSQPLPGHGVGRIRNRGETEPRGKKWRFTTGVFDMMTSTGLVSVAFFQSL